MRIKCICTFLIISLILATILLSACDSGLKIKKIEITQYPDNIVYVIGENIKLDLAGGKVKLITASGQTVEISMNDTRELNISSNADFTRPGVYLVIVNRTADIYCQFPIQVVRSCTRE